MSEAQGAPAEEYRPPGPGARQDPDGVVLASPAVADGSARALRVRVTGTGWQFLAGRPSPEEALVEVPRREVYRHERQLAVLEEFLPVGYGAVREGPTEPWGIGPLSFQDAPPEAPPAAAPPATAPPPTGPPTPDPAAARAPQPRPWWRRLLGR